MEKLNNGCEYCDKKERKMIYEDGGFDRFEVEINEENKLDIDYSIEDYIGRKYIDIKYCPMCGRNLKTGNRMVEVKPLKFPSWEEFQENHFKKTFKTNDASITFKINHDWNRLIVYCWCMPSRQYISLTERKNTPEGYEKACGEIERFRREFVLELAEG